MSNLKCNCACHDSEWNSSKKHTPVKHEYKCCDAMNGTDSQSINDLIEEIEEKTRKVKEILKESKE